MNETNEPTARERALLLRLAGRWRRRSSDRTGQAAGVGYLRRDRLEGEALVQLMRYRSAHPALRDIDDDTGAPLPGHGP